MTTPRLYAPHLYNRHFRLRLPFTLWALAIWAALPGLMLMPKPRLTAGLWGEVWGDWLLLAAHAPVFLVLLAYGYRMPEAGRFWRAVWRHGRALLLAGLVLSAGVLVWRYAAILSNPGHYKFAPAAIILAIYFLFTAYVGLARYLRDLFADYPEKDDDARVRAKPLAQSTPVSPGEAQYREAVEHLKAKRYDPALVALREAIVRDPQHVRAWEATGHLLQKMGYPDEARQAFEAAREAGMKSMAKGKA